LKLFDRKHETLNIRNVPFPPGSGEKIKPLSSGKPFQNGFFYRLIRFYEKIRGR